jgi:hypothetical protein
MAAMGTSGPGNNNVTVEIPKDGAAPPAPNQPAPRSDAIVPDTSAAPDPNELKPNVAPDSNELKPNAAPDANEMKVDPAATDGGQSLPPPVQVNEIDKSTPAASDTSSSSSSTANSASGSSSKPKKKKGLHKIVPF